MAVPALAESRPASRLGLLALSTLVSTIALILMGSIVRVTGHGLGCPDWPLCYGRAIPPFLVGAWMEFTHRLIGLFASVQIAALGWLTWRQYGVHPWLRRGGLALLLLLTVQIPLGGLHVILEIPPETGLMHTAIALAIVGLVALMLPLLHPGLARLGEAVPMGARVLKRSWSLATGLLYVLLLTGSLVTRSGASLACPTWPWCGVPLAEWNTLVVFQVLHRYTAYLTGGFLLYLSWRLWRLARGAPGWRKLAGWLLVALVAQFTLGVLNVLLRIPMTTRALHLTVGSILWALVVLVWALLHHGEVKEAAA